MAKILIVDDSQLVIEMLKDILESADYEVVSVSNASEAMVAVKKELPDLIFMDIMMPGMDGHSVTRLIKFDDRFKNVPIIVFSALDNPHEKELSAQVGALIHLKKTTPPAEILKTVAAALAEKAAKEN